MNLHAIKLRELVIKYIRQYFERLNFQEITTPLLNRSVPLEPNIYAFETKWKAGEVSKNRYLSTSPESYLKKCLATGSGNCFSISPSFRSLEDVSPIHCPEFLMLEWYRENSDYQDIISDVKSLILEVRDNIRLNIETDWERDWPKISMIDLFKDYAQLDLNKLITENDMINTAKAKGYSTNGASWEQLFNQIFLNEIEPKLGSDPCFVTDYPARISPLCKPKKNQPQIAERFELYIGGMEIGNGNTENTDSDYIRQIFETEAKKRRQLNQPIVPIDDDFLKALVVMKGKSYAGMGLGIDRLTMILGNISDISEFY